MHPDFYQGPPMVKPPVVYLARLLRALRPRRRRRRLGLALRHAGQQLFCPPNVSGWDDDRWLDTSRMRARWLVAPMPSTRSPSTPGTTTTTPTETAGTALDAGARRLGLPAAALRAPHRAARFANSARSLSLANWQNSPYRALRQNALLQLIAVCPDMRCLAMSKPRQPQLLQQLHPLAADALAPPPRPARGCRRSRPGCRCRRAPGSRGARSSRAAPGWRWRSTAPRRSRSPPSRMGSPRRPPTDRVLVSVFFDGGIDSLSVLAPIGDSHYAALRPTLAPGPARAPPSREDPRLRWHPARRRLATLHAEGKVSPSRRSATPAPTSRTSPRATSTRSASSRSAPDRLARPLHRPRRHRRQPAPGPLDGRLRSRR